MKHLSPIQTSWSTYRRYSLTVIILVFVTLLTLKVKASPVEWTEGKHKNALVVVPKRALRGGEVRVYYSNGDLVTKQRLKRRKMIIDFSDARAGDYRVVVQKGNAYEEFHYERR